VISSVIEEDQSRGLLWEAGWLSEDTSGGIWTDEAIGSVTWTAAEAFGLDKLGIGKIVVGRRASFVGLNGGPIGLQYAIQFLGDGEVVTTRPTQA
jgi:imidazolonepropionase-like amidohydrolase